MHPALGDVAGAAANGRPRERVVDDSKHPSRADRSSSARDRLAADPPTQAPSPVGDLAPLSDTPDRRGPAGDDVDCELDRAPPPVGLLLDPYWGHEVGAAAPASNGASPIEGDR